MAGTKKKTAEVSLEIDGKKVRAAAGITILEAARAVDIFIPTLCQHEKLEPHGLCRICMVEVEVNGWTKLVAACLYPVAEDLIVRTRSDRVDGIRKMILEFLLAGAPYSAQLLELAQEYGADRERFPKEASFCILCGLCVRYCAEIKKKNAVGYVNSGTRREIYFIPEIALKECADCKECFPLCPTSYLQAAYMLCESMALGADTTRTTP